MDGREGLAGLTRRVDCGEAAAAFALDRVTVEEIMTLADHGQLLPPKVFLPKFRLLIGMTALLQATFFSPKPRPGFMLRLQHSAHHS